MAKNKVKRVVTYNLYKDVQLQKMLYSRRGCRPTNFTSPVFLNVLEIEHTRGFHKLNEIGNFDTRDFIT